jgi:hypothetical protein
MSDIPHARHLLSRAYNHIEDAYPRLLVRRAMALMVREHPKFIVERDVDRPLNKREKRRAVRLRNRGMSLRAISIVLHTNQGRISEAVNPERKKKNGHRPA